MLPIPTIMQNRHCSAVVCTTEYHHNNKQASMISQDRVLFIVLYRKESMDG